MISGCAIFLTLSLILSIFLLAVETHIIYVDDKLGHDDEDCLSEENEPCQSLDYALNGTKSNNVTIMIASGKQEVNSSVTVSGVSDILIEGDSNGSTIIQCDSTVGFKLERVIELSIMQVTFSNCGFVHDTTYNKSVSFQSAVHIVNSSNVTISNISIIDSPGFGLVLVDTNGSVLIENSTFENNRVPDNDMGQYIGGGGIYVEFSSCSPGFDTQCMTDKKGSPYSSDNSYTITGCTFKGNRASLSPSDAPITYTTDNGPILKPFGRGGGLSLQLNGNASRNSFYIENCSFIDNEARIGGAVSVNIDDCASNNTVVIEDDILIENNTAYKGGGGGLVIGFFDSNKAYNNMINVSDATFDSNTAEYGGGVSVYSTRMPFGIKLQNKIDFWDCIWSNNSAEIGAAVVLFPEDWSLISDGYLPTPSFRDCRFVRNYLKFDSRLNFSNGGIISSHTFSIHLSSNIEISNNDGSGLHILTGDIKVLSDSVLHISNNSAVRGGGLMLINFASIIVENHSSIIFRGNNASDVGGAVYYYSSDSLDFVNSRRCFIRFKNDSNISFISNSAIYGKAIYAESLRPCTDDTKYDKVKNSHDYFLRKPFHFESPCLNSSNVISTSAQRINIDNTSQEFSPGIIYKLNINVTDDMDQNIDTVLLATCDDNTKIQSQYKYISEDYKMAINGKVNTTTSMVLQTINARSLGVKFNVTLISCPPGYIINDDEQNSKCVCSVSSEKPIPGIVACNSSSGILKTGYWAGCNESGTLFTAQCPLGYCDYKDVTNNGLITLPSTCDDLEDNLCNEYRKGQICGECIVNYSVHYHSTRFICGECQNDYLGILYYALSELLPLTLLFIFVIYFDVSVTSGSVNSFILFAQVLDFFQVTAFRSYDPPKVVSTLNEIYWFIFGFLNLDFFRHDKLSFCMWNGMSVLDVLAFKYVTSLYGLFLLFCLYILMKCCKPLRTCLGRRHADGRYSIVHGITTLMIITYSQITKVSFQILTRVELCSKTNNCDKKVVFLSGTTSFLSVDHLYYAIPAILVIIYAVLLPFVLIAHPIYLMVKKLLFDKHIIQEKEGHCCCSCFSSMLTKLGLITKPISDSLQSCFKDNMRFFAGLFFLYRLLSSASFAFATTAMAMYSLLEILVLVMLTANAVFQPYQKKFYNVLDTLMFADLALINGMSLYNFASTQYMTDQEYSDLIASVQVVLIYIPFFYVVVLLSLKLLTFKSRSARYKLRHANAYFSLYDPRKLEEDQREDQLRIIREGGDENEAELDDKSWSIRHLPARLFQRDRDLRGQRRGYGTALTRNTM
ncbi:PREDICTED: uncharacterized protein LOC109587684 [Amphimedon queenslandica]|nr:PREDICTED: uncharacterized protein LOC109587684 [Amphimedon queenslandica]|eukprot:XP_019859466.1 PREDICTED: uncharacterized protein LOC109587684 [Amphimedon queenslandica]